MRIMLVASGDLWAGAEAMIYQLVIGLSSIQDIELRVVVFNRERLALDLLQNSIQVDIVEESRYSLLGLAQRLRTIVKEFSPDIIHSHRYKENMIAWLAGGWDKKVKLIATQHGLPESVRGGLSVRQKMRSSLLFRLLDQFFDRTVVVSKEMKHNLVDSYGFTAKKMVVIHNGIAVSDVVRQIDRECCVIGSAGRMFPVKDFSLFVEIARLLIIQNDGLEFVLAGDGPERGPLEEKVKKYGLTDHFYFAGHLDSMDTFYQGLDLYINTSVHEGIPMSVLEAMACGLPTVVPNVGGFPEIVDEGVSGYLITGRDPALYVEKIKRLLQRGPRLSMGIAARQKIASQFSCDAMTQKYYQLYQDLITS